MLNIFKTGSFFLLSFAVNAQENKINVKASLDTEKDILRIQQYMVFHNKTQTKLNEIFLHNWANSYKNNKTRLSKRFIEDYKKNLYFAKEKDRGSTKISNLSVNYEVADFQELTEQIDVLKITLKKTLLPRDSIIITASYDIKIPNAKFTGYGKTEGGYHLRFWYLNPAVYDEEWKVMSNLNMDDLYSDISDFQIEIDIPDTYTLESNLYQYVTQKDSLKTYFLIGKKKTNIILNIDKEANFKSFKTKAVHVKTDIVNESIDHKTGVSILDRALLFIEKYLGKYPHKELFVDKITQRKNPIYGLNQLPKFVRPFSDVFKWDIAMFKAISKKYIENTLLLNTRTDYWLTDGIQYYLMMEYVEKYYPELNLLGNLSKVWGIRSFNFSKLKFNDKYPFTYEFSARKFLDQSLTTRADSLSNFNRKIVSKYKAGLGLRYLEDFLEENVVKNAIQEFYINNHLKITTNNAFANIVAGKTKKDIRWFFGDYIKTNKKIDYTIKKATPVGDSIDVTIKNKRNITAPIALYGIKNKKVIFKKWYTNIDSIRTVRIAKGNFDRLSLNYENTYPEYNTIDNSKNLKKGLFNKPLKLTFIKDINDPYYHQLFYQPDLRYNLYDGLLIGLKLHNRPILTRNLEFSLTPSYGTESKSLTGTFFTRYYQYFEDTSINKILYSVSGSRLHYARDLAYTSFNQSIQVEFKRKTLRDAGGRFLSARLFNVDKEVAPGIIKTDQDKYSIFTLSYFYNRPDIIKGFRYILSTEFGGKFSKVSADIRYRSLTDRNTQLDFRVYIGAFLNNNTKGNYFSFGLDRANDYLFQLNYIGRSENSGIFSQQFIATEGGFKSVLPVRFANEYMVSFNSNIGLWRWLEIYNDVAFLKNRNNAIYFAYENGIRLNFIHNIFELYFPLYSNNGWEIGQDAYSKKIRFVLTVNPIAIFNFIRRGFL
ncbi:MAG: aminopeptidase [Flavobacteriaceae bacterium]|nr:MAG: aminopeptidase [Flavobacteriaceae bacterium]